MVRRAPRTSESSSAERVAHLAERRGRVDLKGGEGVRARRRYAVVSSQVREGGDRSSIYSHCRTEARVHIRVRPIRWRRSTQ